MEHDPDRSAFLIALFHHRWCPAVTAEIARLSGCRFAVLQGGLEVNPVSLRAAIARAISLGLVQRNPGYGHPLRPEYLPTEAGRRVGTRLGRLLTRFRDSGLDELALRKWSMPVLDAVASGKGRFGEMEASLPGITPRALARTLKDLLDSRLVLRTVQAGFPPVSLYMPSTDGRRLARLLALLGKEASRETGRVKRR